MARPCKSVKLLSDYSQTKSELKKRAEVEEKLKGSGKNISPPTYLSTNQKKLFRYIVKELNASEILGSLDIYILSTCCISIDRLQEIEKLINENIEQLFNKDLMSAKDKYTKDFFRCCNELSLSPQSRAKLGNLNLNEKKGNPLREALNG